MTALSPLRVGRITGSRVAAILGVSKYADADSVLRDMVREHFGDTPEFTGNEATAHGQAHEVDAITAYEQSRGVMVYGGQEIVLHPEHDFLAVTPDGLVGDDGMVEVKCPFRARYTHISEKPDYEAQVRLQLECTGRAWCDFVVWRPGRIDVSRVEHDPRWLPSVLGRLAEFHARYLDVIADPDKAAPHRATLDGTRADEEWAEASLAYLDAVRVQDEAKLAVEDARARLLELAGEKSAKGCGVQVIRAERAGAVDYAKALGKYAPDVDLEEFRKPPSVVFTVKEAK
jgi:putative phage-type endonuclease